MSSVDNRIVKMQFNNQRFEQNAKETMSTLDKLKEKLKFKDTTNELNDFQSAANSFNLSHIASAVDQIGDKFTLLGNLGQQAMQRIANAAIDAGISLVKSISVDNIGAGMQKYEQETNTVQALYAALKPKGKTLEDVYGVLDKLAEYSDETSYSYTQMADGVSKFVAAGQDVDRSEVVMEGIANAAALAGVSIQDASIAFRNFSDAMGKGAFQLQDWKSIQNIHMDTEAFKTEVLETAAALGKLEKDANGSFWITTGSGKKAKKQEINAANFGEFLRYDFFDRDVIMATMEKYADRTTELGDSAFKAAQQAKTFTDVMDAVKDAVSTQWKESFRIIFGDLNEAIELFTPMANAVIEFTSSIDSFRNLVLTKWKDAGGRDSMIGVLKDLWETFSWFTEQFKFAVFDVFRPSLEEMEELGALDFGDYLGKKLAKVTEGIKNATQAFKDWLQGANTEDGQRRIAQFRNIFGGILSVVNVVKMAFDAVGTFIGEIFEQLKPTFDAILSLLSLVGGDLLGLNNDLKKQNGFTELAKNLAAIFKPLTDRLPKAINKIKEFYNRLKMFWKTNKRFVEFRKSVEKVFNSFIKFIPKAIDSVIEFGKRMIDTVKNSDEWKKITAAYNKYIAPLVQKIQRLATAFNNALSSFFDMDTSDENTLWGKIKKRFSAFERLGPYLSHVWEDLKENIPWLKDLEDWWNTDPVINEIKEWVSQIAHAVDTFLSEDTSGETSIVGKIKKRFEAMWDELGPWLTAKWDSYKEKYPILQQIEDTLRSLFGWGQTAEQAAEQTEEQTEQTVGILQRIWDKVSEFVGNANFGDFLKFAGAIAVLIEGYKLIKTITGFVGIGEQIQEAIETVGNVIEQAHKKLKADTLRSKAETLLAIAGSVWLIGDTLAKVAHLSWEEIAKGLGGTLLIFGAEAGFMYVLKTLTGSSETEFGPIMGKLTDALSNIGTLISIAVNMIGMSASLWILSTIPWEQMGTALGAMAAIFLGEGMFMQFLNGLTGEGTAGAIFAKLGNAIANSAQLITLSANLLIMSVSLKLLSTIPWDSMLDSLIAMGAIFGMEYGFMKFLDSLTGAGEAGAIFAKLGNAIGNCAQLITLAANLLIAGLALKLLSTISWEQMGTALGAMAAIFLGEGMFIQFLDGLGGGGSLLSTLSGAASGSLVLITLGNNLLKASFSLKTLSEIPWDKVIDGLIAMAGILGEEGVFTYFLSTLGGNKIDAAAITAATGLLGSGVAQLANSVKILGDIKFDKMIKGISGVGVLMLLLYGFVNVISDPKFTKVNVKSMFGIVTVSGAIWIMAKALEPLCHFNMDQIVAGLTGMIGVATVLGLFMYAMQSFPEIGIKQLLSVFPAAIALAAMMVAFAFALSMIKDVDSTTILAFGSAMVLVSGAMSILSTTLQLFSGMSLGAAVKGTAIMLIAAAGLAAAVALILTITGSAIEGFSGNIAVVGANLAQYSDQVADINMEAVNNSITMIKDLAAAFVEVGAKDYGNLDSFRTNLTRMGGSLKLFGMNTTDLDTEKMKTIAGALKEVATDLSGFPEVADVGTSIANIGGALKLYSESTNGIDLSNVPDSTAIKTVFDALSSSLPDDENLTMVAGYASEGKGDEMTNFAIGLTNIATAVSSFSESAKDLDFGSITKATEALTAISTLNTSLETTTVARFGPFALEVSQQKESLSTFAEDIVTLGTALQAFGTNISKVKEKDLTTGTSILEKIVEVNNALPKTGGISQWITGTQNLTNFAANLRLLGNGAKEFGEAVSGSTFDAASVTAAGDALIKIAEVNGKLPKTGGISSWFTGDESLAGFGKNLKDLGEGVAGFAEGLGDTKIDQNITDAVSFISKLAGIQVRLSGADSWYTLGSLAFDMAGVATNLKTVNDDITGVTWADTTGFEHLLDFATGQQIKLGSTSYTKNLKSIGQDLKGFFEEVWSFTQNWVGKDTGKLDKVTESVTGIFTALNDAFDNANSDGSFTAAGLDIIKYLSDGIQSENSITNVKNAAQAVAKAAWTKIHPDNDTNFYNTGTWIPAGLASGIRDNQSAVVNAIVSMVSAGIRAGKNLLQIKSPSRVFAEMGMYSDQGLAQGLLGSVGVVEQAGQSVSKSAVSSVLNGLTDITSLPLSDMDITPTIRPVLDTSDISSRAGMIDGLLGGTRSIGFNTRQLEAQAQILGNTTATDLGTVTQRVTDLGAKLDELNIAITNMKIVMNNGALVGAIASDMDKSLGNRGRRAERGG